MSARAQAGASRALCLLALAVAGPTCPGDSEACRADHEDVGLLQTLRKGEAHKHTGTGAGRAGPPRAAAGEKAPSDEPTPSPAPCESGTLPEGFRVIPAPASSVISAPNPCEGTTPSSNPAFDDSPCYADGVVQAMEQAGANITEGYVGGMDVGDRSPWNLTFFEGGLCPVNVHFHYGTEHLSAGEFDAHGSGPSSPAAEHEGTRLGFRCHLYNESDPKFTTPYDWKYCVDVRVGETYEVHWPHSAAGACGTPFQYQTPFLDGVFCNAATVPLSPLQDTVGVHGQVFVVVNDEDNFYPDLMKGMIIDPGSGFGSDIAYYTGSTTGTSFNNEVCSAYSPITWQVDRKCNLISASSFDKMCSDMLLQVDDMSADLVAHGARELVANPLAADNLQRF